MYNTALAALFLSALSLFGAPAQVSEQQPVYIVLYSRFYDHSHPHSTDERLSRLLALLNATRAKYPQSGASALLQFSGTVSEALAEQNEKTHVIDALKDAAAHGFVEFGYTGEEEPSYLYRPKPNLFMVTGPEARWAAHAEAAEHFLADFKQPVTGLPVEGVSGGLKRMQEVFGPAAFASGITTLVGGDSPYTHQFRKHAPEALLPGILPSDIRRGIEGYGFSAENFSKFMSPVAATPPDAFWEDGVLRISDQSLPDNRPRNTQQKVAEMKTILSKLDRSHVRVIKIEVTPYSAYLTKRPDGSIAWDPMEWMYYHPDAPQFPGTMKPLLDQSGVEAAYRNERAVIEYLAGEFIPANPGSRFLSIHDLKAMADNTTGAQLSRADVLAIAGDVDARFKEIPNKPSNFVTVGGRYFSNAEAFAVLAQSVAGLDPQNGKAGAMPSSVRLGHVLGPLLPGEDAGPVRGSVTVAEVIHAAAIIAPVLANDAWKPVPDNAVPTWIQVGEAKVNSTQFLRLMAWACLDPTPGRVLTLNAMQMESMATFMFPKNTPIAEQGVGWTFKPAALKVPKAPARAGN